MGKGTKKRVPAERIDTGPPRKAVPALAGRPHGFAPVASTLFRVRWNRFDYGGPWCIGASTPDQIVNLMQRVTEMESMTPIEVFRPSQKQLGVDYGDPANIPLKECRDRLAELGLIDETCVSRLRIGWQGRLYGFRRDPEFYAVFWDPKHEIWS